MRILFEWRPGPTAPLCVQIFERCTPIRLEAHKELSERLLRWNADYRAEKLPSDGTGDADWLAEGIGLLAEVRRVIGEGYRVEAADPWWPDDPDGGVQEPRRPTPNPDSGAGIAAIEVQSDSE
jgi:hypothetical protein